MDEIYTLETPPRNMYSSNDLQQMQSTPIEPTEYITSISELIAEPNQYSTIQYFLTSLYQLSEYLFQKKIKAENKQQENLSFDQYLNEVNEQITIYDNLHRKSQKSILSQISSNKNAQLQQFQLVQCYNRVPYIYFTQKFILDFGDLKKHINQITQKQEQLNQCLDLVEINLFSQIHFKFHEYFKIVANFDYLGQSLKINIVKIKESRKSIAKVQTQFVEKSEKLRKKIIQRQNIQKVMKLLRIIKSMKKLPFIIKEILESSLPYQCLSLLKSTKQTLKQTQGLHCLSKTAQNIKNNQNTVQMGLTKRYADQLYLYLQQCQLVNLQQIWDRINAQNCIDVSLNSSQIMGQSTILQQSFMDMQPSISKNKRQQGKQYQISMILIQSYRYINFPVDLTRIKISNSLRIFSKKFDQNLALCLHQILQQKKQKILQQNNHQDQQQKHPKSTPPTTQNNEENNNALTKQLVEKVTLIFYVKHIHIYNEIMKDTIDRYLGYLQTLLNEYKESKIKDESKFLAIFKEELTILPSIIKIVIEKLKSLMSLKNISGVGLNQFKQWMCLLEYWEKYTDYLIDEHPLINYQGPISGIQQAVSESMRKMFQILNIKSTITQLSLNFIASYHTNVLNNQLYPTLNDESWQSIQIPSEFMQIINNVALWQNGSSYLNQNISITILNQSSDKSLILDKNGRKDLDKSDSSFRIQGNQKNAVKAANKFRVLKNNILFEGNRYKISVSLLLLIEFLEQYVKIGRTLKFCQKFVYQRLLELIDVYNQRSKQLILLTKARENPKFGTKNISAKYLCLVHNCITVVVKLLEQMQYQKVSDLLAITIKSLNEHRQNLIEKLSSLLLKKINPAITKFVESKPQEKKSSQTNIQLLKIFVQMMGIVDEYLYHEERQLVFRESMFNFITRYFKQLLLRGKSLLGETRILVEKMKFMRQYFPEELELMEKELQRLEQPEK